MNILILILLVLVNLIFSSSILPYISIFGVVPNTSILLLVSICLLKGRPYGGIIGIVTGLLQDIMFGSTIGINALVYFIIGYGITNSNRRISRDNIFIPVALSMGMIIVYNLLYSVFIYFIGIEVSLAHYIKSKLLIELIYSGILMIPIYKGLSRIFVAPTIRFVRD